MGSSCYHPSDNFAAIMQYWCVCHWLLGLLLSKAECGIFNMCSDPDACCAHEGEITLQASLSSTLPPNSAITSYAVKEALRFFAHLWTKITPKSHAITGVSTLSKISKSLGAKTRELA